MNSSTAVILRNLTTACQISQIMLISFRLRKATDQQTTTVNKFKAKLKKNYSVVSLLDKNKQRQSQCSQKHAFRSY